MKHRILLPLIGALLVPVGTQATSIFWVSFHPDDNTPSAAAAAAGFTKAPDAGYTQLLRENGYNVTRVLTTSTPNVAQLNAADLVIISRSVPSSNYQDDAATAAWNGIKAPSMILGGYILRNSRLGYTTGTTIPDTVGTVSLKVTDPTNPIFKGLPLGPDNVMATPFATAISYNGVVQQGISVNTDPLAGGGKVLATVGTQGDPAFGGMLIGEWSAGATMSTSPADTLGGHRMVFLTGSRENGITSEAAGMYNLTPDGARLFLNAVSYMAVPEPSTIALLAVAAGALCLVRRRD